MMDRKYTNFHITWKYSYLKDLVRRNDISWIEDNYESIKHILKKKIFLPVTT